MGGIYGYKRPELVLITNVEGQGDGALWGDGGRGSSVEGDRDTSNATSSGDTERTD